MARLNPSSTLIGVDLGGTHVRAGLVRRSKIVKLASQPVRSRGTPDEIMEDISAVIDAVRTDSVHGIGIGAPSLIDGDRILATTNIPNLRNIDLGGWLKRKYRVPVRINNDANCFALGEQAYGLGEGVENFVGLIIGTGLGAGIISRGRLHSGLQCGAGEFGLIPYQNGIIENFASGQFFRRFNMEGEEVHDQAKHGDPEALRVMNEYGKHIGHAIKTILYAVAPEMIVLGGSVSLSYPFFKSSLEESLEAFAYTSMLKKLKIKVSKTKNIAVLGAARLIIDQDI